ncbi:MAG: DUF885 domain-containing protein [Gammaproteobacteria bacterium]
MRPFALLVSLFFCLSPSIAAPADIDGEADTQQFKELLETQWQRYLREHPLFASQQGDYRYNDRWPDLSENGLRNSHLADIAALDELEKIDRSQLSELDRVNYDLFRRRLENRLDIYAAGRHVVYQGNQSEPVSARNGVHTRFSVVERIRMEQESDFEQWATRLERFGTYLDQSTDLLRQGLEEGIVLPRNIVERILEQVDTLASDNALSNPFYGPFADIPTTIPRQRRMSLQDKGLALVNESVIPAFKRYREFLETEYLPVARQSVGLSAEPGGADFYANRIRYFTTTDLTWQQIHEIGLAEVARIRKEMLGIIEETGFEGSFADFLTFLRTDPQFYYDNPQDLYQAYLATSKRIDPELVKLFGHLPRTPYGVRPIPAATAPHTTTAYYNGPAQDGSRAGYYYVNLYRPDVRPKYEIEVLTVHEAMPGHHLESALTLELNELPTFRRHDYLTAFSEGWALYSESLGGELGLYTDPYSRFGQLTYEMWRAVRLVIDTGIHAMNWDRQKAIDYFKDNAAKTELDIINEVDRYISWPGQALAYKIGELEIKALRAEAEETLGDEFDIRAFHDQLLANGQVPLNLLKYNTRKWIESVEP